MGKLDLRSSPRLRIKDSNRLETNRPFLQIEQPMTNQQHTDETHDLELFETKEYRVDEKFYKDAKLFVCMHEVVKDMKSAIMKTPDFGWFPTDHLSKAAKMLEEGQKVLMYSQVFAFYLGCQ